MPQLLDSVVEWLSEWKAAILLTWFVIAAACIYPALQFQNRTTQAIEPPKDTQAYDARHYFRVNYPRSYHSTGFVIFAESTTNDENIGTSKDFIEFDRALENFLFNGTLDPESNPAIPKKEARVEGYSSFRSVPQGGLPPTLIRQYLSARNVSAISNFRFKGAYDSTEAMDFKRSLEDALMALQIRHGILDRFDISAFSIPSFTDELGKSSKEDLVVTFAIALPLSFIVFCAALTSVRLAIFPFLSLLVTAPIVSAIMFSVSYLVPVSAVAVGVGSSLSLLCVMDYNLFLVARYRKEVRRDTVRDGTNLVRATLSHASRSISSLHRRLHV